MLQINQHTQKYVKAPRGSYMSDVTWGLVQPGENVADTDPTDNQVSVTDQQRKRDY